MRHAAVFDAAANFAQQIVAGGYAGVGHQQRCLQVFVKRFVDLRARENAGNAAARLAQAGLELVQPGFASGQQALGRRRVLGRNRRDQCAADQTRC